MIFLQWSRRVCDVTVCVLALSHFSDFYKCELLNLAVLHLSLFILLLKIALSQTFWLLSSHQSLFLGFSRSSVLKASSVECWSFPLINTSLTLHQHVGVHSINTPWTSQLMVNWLSQLISSWYVCQDTQSTINGLLIKCQLSSNWVSIKMLLEGIDWHSTTDALRTHDHTLSFVLPPFSLIPFSLYLPDFLMFQFPVWLLSCVSWFL